MKVPRGIPFFCSWSGGKDSCLALHRAIRDGGLPRFLLTTLEESGERSRGHGIPLRVIEAQAESLGIPLYVRATSWEDYEENFSSVLRELRDRGIEAGVFGDINIEGHREWVERVCQSHGMHSFLPLWGEKRAILLEELVGAGFKATIVAVREGALAREYLGRTLDLDLVGELRDAGVDVSGENGEYHTVVTDGPLFSRPVPLEHGGYVHRDGVWFLEVSQA